MRTVPMIGKNNQQSIMVDISHAVYKKCECGSVHFDKVYKVGTISKLTPGNKTGQDIIVEVPVYICHGCGMELNPIENQLPSAEV